MAWDFTLPQWSRSSKKADESKAQQAAPAPDPTPYVVPHPIGRSAPYVAANHDYSDNPEYPNYNQSHGGRRLWRNRKVEQGGEVFVAPPSTYPPAGHAPEAWHGYTMEDYWDSQRNEHLINGDEGRPPVGYKRYHPALNPYWNKIPDSRPVRTAHEWDFRRPFDGGLGGQNKVPARRLSGDHYAAGNQGMTANPSESLKGMRPQSRRRTTYRMEPVEWGEDRPMSGSGYSAGLRYTSNDSFGGSYAL